MTEKETMKMLSFVEMIDEVMKHFENNNWLNVKEFQLIIKRANKNSKKKIKNG